LLLASGQEAVGVIITENDGKGEGRFVLKQVGVGEKPLILEEMIIDFRRNGHGPRGIPWKTNGMNNHRLITRVL
jgi:hypothetical protein